MYASIPNNKRFTSITGAQGRIRTSVPRKEEQIYSLSALTTHPPVPKTPVSATSGSHGFPVHTPGLHMHAEIVQRIKRPSARNHFARIHREKAPIGVPMEKLYTAAPRQSLRIRNEFANLELAKGFEPLTL